MTFTPTNIDVNYSFGQAINDGLTGLGQLGVSILDESLKGNSGTVKMGAASITLWFVAFVFGAAALAHYRAKHFGRK